MTPGNETIRLGARWRAAPNPRRLHAHARREHAVRRSFAEEVFGSKNLKYAADWLADDFVEHQVFPGTTPDKKGAIDSYRIFFAASPDMTAEIHDMVAAGDKVAIRATYRGTDEGGFIPNIRLPETLRNGGHLRSPDQPPGTNRRALECRRHHRNNGTAGPASAPRMSGRCPGDFDGYSAWADPSEHACPLSFKPLRRIGHLATSR